MIVVLYQRKNLISLGKSGWNTLCGLPMRKKEKEAIRNFVKNNSINHISNMVQLGSGIFYVKGISHSFGAVKGKLAICYNENKKLYIAQSRRLKIIEAQILLKEKNKVEDEFKKYLTPTGRIKYHVIEEEEELDGYSCIFCTKNMRDEDMVKLYFDKDIVERAFKVLKGVSNLRPIRFWVKEHVEAHIFICYLSCLLLSVLKLDLKFKKIDISPKKAIEDLETMYNIYFSEKRKNVKFLKTVVLSKHQEKILRAVDPKLLKSHIIV